MVRPEVLFIDDIPFVLDAWEDALNPGAVVHLRDSPEDLAARLELEPNFFERLASVITDHNFDGSSGDALDVGRMIKSRRTSLTVLLSSDAEFDGINFSDAVNRLIPKQPVPYAELGLN